MATGTRADATGPEQGSEGILDLPRSSALADLLAAAVFVLALALPALDLALDLDPVPERQPEQRLRWSAALEPDLSLRERIEALQRAAARGFGLRNALVLGHGLASFELFGRSGNEDVIVGKDGWLFLRKEDALDGHRNLRPFSAPIVASLVDAIDAQHRWLAARGIAYLLVIVPDKHTIYSRQLPAWTRPLDAPSRLDQIARALAQRTDVDFLDLTPALERAGQQERVYHRTDTHWNAVGAHAGYRAILERLAPEIRLQALPRTDFAETTSSGFSGDLARMLGLGGVLVEEAPQWSPRRGDGAVLARTGVPVFRHEPRYGESFVTRSRDDRQPRALIVRDSFGDALFPYLAQHFSQARFAWIESFDLGAQLPALLAAGEPDVVIHVLAERALMRVGATRDAEEARTD